MIADVAPMLVLLARAEARALLYAAGEYDLHEAVDALAVAADAAGINTDAAQAVIAQAFEAVEHDR